MAKVHYEELGDDVFLLTEVKELNYLKDWLDYRIDILDHENQQITETITGFVVIKILEKGNFLRISYSYSNI